jgi:hypothetical protein
VLVRITSEWLERGSEMSDETLVDQPVEEKVEEPKRQFHFSVEIGKSSAAVVTEEALPSLKGVLAEAMGIPGGLIFLEEVQLSYEGQWHQPQLLVQFHVGPNSKVTLRAVIGYVRY